MTDPMDGLNGLQLALNAGTVQLSQCDVHPGLKVLLDHPNNTPRFTYAQVDGKSVQAIALIVLTEPLEALPCFQLGFAVVEPLRGRGVGSRIVRQAMDELVNGLSRTPMKEFYLEAVVSRENHASIAILKRLISEPPKSCKDGFSGDSAFQYLQKIPVRSHGSTKLIDGQNG